MRFRIFVITTITPLLIVWASLHQNERLLTWAILELPKLLTEGKE